MAGNWRNHVEMMSARWRYAALQYGIFILPLMLRVA